MTRFVDWTTRLEKYLHASRTKPFAWGTFDCCLFVADAINAMTGVDLATDYRGQYDSALSAMSAINTIAGRPSVEAVAERAARQQGMVQVPVLFARRGDMVLVPRDGDFGLGLVALNGTDVLVALETGYGTVPITTAAKAWRV